MHDHDHRPVARTKKPNPRKAPPKAPAKGKRAGAVAPQTCGGCTTLRGTEHRACNVDGCQCWCRVPGLSG